LLLQVLLKELKGQDRGAGSLQQFEASEVLDLPPRLRALVEDNKVGGSAGKHGEGGVVAGGRE
jgi:hypothetical protein